MKIAHFAEAEALLKAFIPRPLDMQAVYNLDTIRALMTFLGDPQDQLKVIHVAGTSGKTSTAYYAAALLRAGGRQVGLTVSPHIEQVSDRVQIDGQPLSEADFCAALSEFMDVVGKSGLKPTYFELLMAFAYWEFARRGVDYAVVEVGLGGLLDGSNVVTRSDKVCVITDIGLDHTAILGSTLAEIAAQKAGIIHPKNEVFMYEQGREVMDVVRKVCARQQAGLQIVASAKTPSELEFLPLYQQRNLGLALAAVRFVLQRDGPAALQPAAIQKAAAVRIPGRMETFRIGQKTVILDGAHNTQKLSAMAAALHATYGDQPLAALVGFVERREDSLPKNAAILAGLVDHIIVTEFGKMQEHGGPSMEPEVVAAACRQAGAMHVTVLPAPERALEQLLAAPEKVLLVTGSLYLVSRIRPLVLQRAKA